VQKCEGEGLSEIKRYNLIKDNPVSSLHFSYIYQFISKAQRVGHTEGSVDNSVMLIWQKINPLLSNALHRSERLDAARFKF